MKGNPNDNWTCHELLESRKALLHYYNSQTTTHAGFLITLVVGGLTLVAS